MKLAAARHAMAGGKRGGRGEQEGQKPAETGGKAHYVVEFCLFKECEGSYNLVTEAP